MTDAIKRARQEVFDLCSGKRRWTMRVPPEDTDSDLIILAGLDAAASPSEPAVQGAENAWVFARDHFKVMPAMAFLERMEVAFKAGYAAGASAEQARRG